jgi:hypothetical protein
VGAVDHDVAPLRATSTITTQGSSAPPPSSKAPKRRGACTECRSAKVKCDHQFPCSRCKRLSKECRAHQSKQGQRRPNSTGSHSANKRKRGDCSSFTDNSDEEQNTEDAMIGGKLLQEGCALITCDHYGIRCLVRSWVAIAFRRRSFGLLARAANMACRCNIEMDQILCEMGNQRGMDFLYPTLLTERPKQEVLVEGGLSLSNVPDVVARACHFNPLDPTSFKDRLIFIRDINKGISSFYCSPGFEQNIVSRSKIEETYRENKTSVTNLYMVDHNTHKTYTQAIAHQIALNKTPCVCPKPTRVSRIKIKAIHSITPVEVDQVICHYLESLDRQINFAEYIPSQVNTTPSTMESLYLASVVPQFPAEFEIANLEELAFDEDTDLAQIYELLAGT